MEVWGKFDEYLTEAGLSPGLENSLFVESATRHLLRAVEAVLSQDPSVDFDYEKVFDCLARSEVLRFGHLKVPIAVALLKPFAKQKAPERARELVGNFLCQTIGDPRIHRRHWHDIPEEVRNVLLRWLVGDSLEDFFRVLDRTALDRHWVYRRAFWLAYFDRELIDDAWIVVDPAAAPILRRNFAGEVRAGRLRRGANVQVNHSVLLLCIRGVTIAEWSHNGKCRVWRRGNP